MADPDLQALLDPSANLRGYRILRRVDVETVVNGNPVTYSDYYIQPPNGPAKWVRVNAADSDADKNTAIRAALPSAI